MFRVEIIDYYTGEWYAYFGNKSLALIEPGMKNSFYSFPFPDVPNSEIGYIP